MRAKSFMERELHQYENEEDDDEDDYVVAAQVGGRPPDEATATAAADATTTAATAATATAGGRGTGGESSLQQSQSQSQNQNQILLVLQQLQSKLEALEAQNILVSVQQLDWLSWGITNTLWTLSVYGYAKLCGYVLRQIEEVTSRSSRRVAVRSSSSTPPPSASKAAVSSNNNNNTNLLLWSAYHPNNSTTKYDDTDVSYHINNDTSRHGHDGTDLTTTTTGQTTTTTKSSDDDDWMIFWSIQLGMVGLPLIYNYFTRGKFYRRIQIFSTAAIILARIKLCRWREHNFVQQLQQTQSPQLSQATTTTTNPTTTSNNSINNTVIPRYGESCTMDGIWESNYEISARFLWLSVSRLRGLWTKSAQYLSSRADFMPVSYIRELSKLQDDAPATPWKDVEHLLPPQLRNAIIDVDTTPIASASIGQVHVATINYVVGFDQDNDDNDDGGGSIIIDDDPNHPQRRVKTKKKKVVIKIQHPHARTLMIDDFWSLKVICRVVGWLEPDYKFMEILMNEWAVEARKELDFTNEAYHLDLARSALEEWRTTHSTTSVDDGGVGYTMIRNKKTVPFQVEVPEPLKEFSNDRVLVMEYCDGCRVDDFQQLSKWKLSRHHVLDALSQTFAYFMYQSRIFNGDPHVRTVSAFFFVFSPFLLYVLYSFFSTFSYICHLIFLSSFNFRLNSLEICFVVPVSTRRSMETLAVTMDLHSSS